MLESLETQDAPEPGGLYTVNAGGFSATCDAFARDPGTESLWFLSMVGPQSSLKAIWGSLLKQPPDVAHLIEGVEGLALSGGFQRCHVPRETVGTWTTKIAKLPGGRGWHAIVYTKMAEFSFERSDFLLLALEEEQAPDLHYRFLDKRSPLPLHHSWKDWLWHRGLDNGEISPLESTGIRAYRCCPEAKQLREDLSQAVAAGTLTLTEEEPARAVGGGDSHG